MTASGSRVCIVVFRWSCERPPSISVSRGRPPCMTKSQEKPEIGSRHAALVKTTFWCSALGGKRVYPVATVSDSAPTVRMASGTPALYPCAAASWDSSASLAQALRRARWGPSEWSPWRPSPYANGAGVSEDGLVRGGARCRGVLNVENASLPPVHFPEFIARSRASWRACCRTTALLSLLFSPALGRGLRAGACVLPLCAGVGSTVAPVWSDAGPEVRRNVNIVVDLRLAACSRLARCLASLRIRRRFRCRLGCLDLFTQ